MRADAESRIKHPMNVTIFPVRVQKQAAPQHDGATIVFSSFSYVCLVSLWFD